MYPGRSSTSVLADEAMATLHALIESELRRAITVPRAVF